MHFSDKIKKGQEPKATKTERQMMAKALAALHTITQVWLLCCACLAAAVGPWPIRCHSLPLADRVLPGLVQTPNTRTNKHARARAHTHTHTLIPQSTLGVLKIYLRTRQHPKPSPPKPQSCIDRAGPEILMRDLPLKTEFVLQLALAPSQLALYQMVGRV
mgnify:CR=1 FL=1